jgi:hypothetical protein
MGGGLMQLVAYGAQDIYLTGNPQITFFKVVYRRHTNFSMEAVAQTFSGNQVVGSRVSSTISRNGDLISKMYYEYNPRAICPAAGNIPSHLGHALFNEIELEIGGQKIDKHYGHWLTVWNTLTEPNEGSFLNLVNATGTESPAQTRYTKMAYTHGGITNGAANTTQAPVKAFVPFQFWFNRNPGLALPLIALQYHEVKVNITFSNAASLSSNVANGGAIDPNGQLWVDYIYLDTDERRRFAQQSHEYLIEQLQFQQAAGANSIELNFNHPVKEIIWTGQPIPAPLALQGVATPPGAAIAIGIVSAANGGNTNDTYQLKLNGHDRFAARHPFYFSRTQVYQHHSGSGLLGAVGAGAGDDRIAVYSFALKPEEHQPSGTCNFSRIDNARLDCNIAAGNPPLNIYAVNYNVLRIMSGMGGLAYSN